MLKSQTRTNQGRTEDETCDKVQTFFFLCYWCQTWQRRACCLHRHHLSAKALFSSSWQKQITYISNGYGLQNTTNPSSTLWDWPAECAGAWEHACRWTSEEHCSVWRSQTSASDLSQHARHSRIRCSSSCSCGELRALTFGKEGTEILYCTVSVCDAVGVENKKERMLVKQNKTWTKMWKNEAKRVSIQI